MTAAPVCWVKFTAWSKKTDEKAWSIAPLKSLVYSDFGKKRRLAFRIKRRALALRKAKKK
jgi:hypothetical protein